MIYSGWQALYGTYCIGLNRLSIYHRYVMILLCTMIAPTLYAWVSGSFSEGMNILSLRANSAEVITFISPENIGSRGYVIDTPGTYCVTGDIYFSPDMPGRAAITIKGQGVTLLLDTISIKQVGTMPDTHGIFLDGASGITIHGSSITGFTGNGLYAIKSEALVFDTIESSHNAIHGFLFEQCDGIVTALCTARYNRGKGIAITGKNSFGGEPRIVMQGCAEHNN
jgi:hypothetical protein